MRVAQKFSNIFPEAGSLVFAGKKQFLRPELGLLGCTLAKPVKHSVRRCKDFGSLFQRFASLGG